MPFDLKTENGILYFAFRGEFNLADLRNGAEAASQIEAEAAISPDRIIDISAVESMNLNFADMQALVKLRRAAPLKNNVKSAIVALTPVQYGFARMFQTILENPKITVEIFMDQDSARAWIIMNKNSGPSVDSQNST